MADEQPIGQPAPDEPPHEPHGLVHGGSTAELFSTLEEELRQIARLALAKERGDHTLQPTALLNELWLRLARDHRLAFDSRSAFLAFAARAVRNILVDHARKRLARKRGGNLQRTDLGSADHALDDYARSILDLEDELLRLAEMHPRCARVFELHYFGGLSMSDIAPQLDIAERTVRNDWATAKAWLRVRLDGETD